jgi:hypothetical protein
LAGYSVECALKACIAKQTKEYDFPNLRIVKDSWTHDVERLLNLAELKDTLENVKKSDKNLDTFWAMVVNWKEEKRYDLDVKPEEAKNLYDAISDPVDGVLQWLKKWW